MASMTRPIATLSISFGLVAIPVKAYSAAAPAERLAFHLLRKSDGSRIKERFFAVNDGKPVERADMVKGYEFSKGKYVTFTPEELKSLEDASSSTVDITEFVPLDSVDPMYFLASYYLLPDKGGAKPYALLSSALDEERRCAVGKWISRGKEHVILLRSVDGGLALHELHFQAELRELKDLGYEPAAVSASEVKLARQLIGQLSAEKFDPGDFADEHRARVRAEIKKKTQGKAVSIAEPEPAKPSSNVIDLMEALKKSLRSTGDRRPPARAPKKGRTERAALRVSPAPRR